MKKTITIIILIFLVGGCKPKLGKYYFEFDEVTHFAWTNDEMKLFDRMGQPDITQLEQLEEDVVINDLPYSIKDTLFIPKLTSIGFVQHELTKEQRHSIKEIFREKKIDGPILQTSCVAVYRDVLIFRKHSRIVGIAKICTSCHYHQIHGAKVNPAYFGESGDYNKLKTILKN